MIESVCLSQGPEHIALRDIIWTPQLGDDKNTFEHDGNWVSLAVPA